MTVEGASAEMCERCSPQGEGRLLRVSRSLAGADRGRGSDGPESPAAYRNRYPVSITSSSGTIAIPIGQSARPASLMCAQANGMPMIVTANATASIKWPSASHHPASTSHRMLPTTPSAPVPGILVAGQPIAAHRAVAERQQGVERDVEGGPRPRDADDRHHHDERGDQPGGGHPYAAEDDPQHVQQQANQGHRRLLAAFSQGRGSRAAGRTRST